MTLPTLKKHVYQALEPISDNQTPHLILIEAKLNVLHATYLALLSEPRLDDDLILKGQQVFQTLFSRHFEENQEVGVRRRETLGGREREKTERKREREKWDVVRCYAIYM